MEKIIFDTFQNWFEDELKLTKVRIQTACCLSTIGTDNYPNARFVSRKGVIEKQFIVTGTITSRKGVEFQTNFTVPSIISNLLLFHPQALFL